MLYAEDASGKLVAPREVATHARCPVCGDSVIPKQGDVVIDHFAHENRDECDPWAETEMSPWHLFWQHHVEPNRREVVCKYPGDDQKHRADMLAPSGHVIEAQHSHLSVSDVAKREAFYSRVHRGLVWVVDARGFWSQIETYLPGLEEREEVGQLRYELRENGETGSVEFRWSHPRTAWFAAECEVYLDPGRLQLEGGQRMFDGALFHVLSADLGDDDRWENYDPYDARHQRPEGNGPSGYGEFVTANEFRKRYRLKLPDDPSTAENYPSPRPNVTQTQIRERGTDWSVPAPTTL